MISLFATERTQQLAPRIRTFVETELFPIEPILMEMRAKAAEERLRRLRPKVQALGAWNLYLPTSYGGPGLSLMEIAQLAEILGRSPFGHLTFNCNAPDAGNVELLMHYGGEAIKNRFLQPLLKGEQRSCFAMTEPDYAGSNPVRLATTARREGNDYIINGHKWFTTGADGAAFAIVMAVTDPDNPNPYGRASMIVVPTGTEGFVKVRNLPVMGEPEEGVMSHSEIRFENCRVPVSNRLGEEGAGFRLAQERLGPGRIHHCMRWIGLCERAFSLMCRRAATREIAEGVMLGDRQTVQNWIAESRADIDAARLLVLHAAHKMEAAGQKAASREISTIKFFVANVLQQVVDRAIQTFGAAGLTDDHILAWIYRHERGARIYDGPDEVHKASLARKVLKDYS